MLEPDLRRQVTVSQLSGLCANTKPISARLVDTPDDESVCSQIIIMDEIRAGAAVTEPIRAEAATGWLD